MNIDGSYPFVVHVNSYILSVLGYGIQPGSRWYREMLAADRLKLVKVQEDISLSLVLLTLVRLCLLSVFVIFSSTNMMETRQKTLITCVV